MHSNVVWSETLLDHIYRAQTDVKQLQTLWQNKQIVHPLMVRQFIQKARHVPVKASQCEHEQSQVLLLKKKEALCSIPKALRFVLASDASVFLFCKLLNPFVRFNPI